MRIFCPAIGLSRPSCRAATSGPKSPGRGRPACVPRPPAPHPSPTPEVGRVAHFPRHAPPLAGGSASCGLDTRPVGRAFGSPTDQRRCGAAAQDHRTSGRRDSTIKCGAPGDPPEQPDNPDRWPPPAPNRVSGRLPPDKMAPRGVARRGAGRAPEHEETAVSDDQPPPPGWGQPAPPPPGAQTWPPPPGARAPSPHPPRLTQGRGGRASPGPTSPPGPTAPYPAGPPAPHPTQPLLAAHKPGAIPLRPLVLGDIFDGAFRIIRYNTGATVGAAVLVSAVAMIIPVVTGLVTGSTGGLDLGANAEGLTHDQVAGLVTTLGSFLIGTQLQSIGLLFVSGMIAHVTSAAAVGRKLTMAEAWAATHGKRWRLFGMSVLLGLVIVAATLLVAAILLVGILAFDAPLGDTVLVGVVLGLVLVVGYAWFWVRVRALAVPTLMLEPVGVFGALRRAVRLTQQQFWRLFGILLLMALVVGFAGNILQAPFTIIGNLFLVDSTNSYGLTLYLLLTAVGVVLSSAVLQPFQAAVNALLYVDQRIRKEAYDVELLGRAGILPG